MSNILLSKLCCGRFYLANITPECKYHVMPLIWCWGQLEGTAWPPSGKKGGLSCFPQLVLRAHSADNNIIAHRGTKSLASTGVLCGQDLGSELVWMCGRIVEC